MKYIITYILSFALWTNALAISIDELYRGLNFDSTRTGDSSISLSGVSSDIDISGGPDDGLSDEERALMMAAEMLAQQRADCNDGKGGIEVGIIDVVRIYPDEDNPGKEIEKLEKVDCNQVALLEYKLLEEKLGSDKAFECTTKNWYLDEQVKFAKELDLPMQKHFCKEKQSPEEKARSLASKAMECAGSVACNMLKTPMGEAVGIDPIADVVKYLSKGTDFGKGCEKTPGNGCISTALWGIFKNLFSNIEGIWDLGKMIVGGAVDYVSDKATRAWKWAGDKIFGTDSLAEYDRQVAARADLISQQGDGFFAAFKKDFVGATGSLVSGLFTGIMDMIVEGTKDNFMCGGNWYTQDADWNNKDISAAEYHSAENKKIKSMGSRAMEDIMNFGGDVDAARHDKIRCDQPFISECASCGQWMNMVCGVMGFLGGEVITAVLTGGAVNLVGKGAKGAAMGGKALSAALRSTNKWDEFAKLGKAAGGKTKDAALKGFDNVKGGAVKGLEGLKGAATGTIEKLTEFSFKGMAASIGKNGKNLIFRMGNKTVELGKNGIDSLLAALKKGREMGVTGLGKATLKAPFKIGGKVIKTGFKASKSYLQLLDDAFIFGMQGNQGLKIARMAKESQRIRKELKGLQEAADKGDPAARALLAAHQKRLQILEDHQKLTKAAMKAKTPEARTDLLAQAQRKAGELDGSAQEIAAAKQGFDAKKAEQIKLAGEHNAASRVTSNGTTTGGAADNVVAGADNAVSPGRSYGTFKEEAAEVGMRNADTVTLSRKPASLKVDDVVKTNPKIRDRITELGRMKGPDGAPALTETKQSFINGILNNADAAKREELIKKIADEGWDSVRRSCN